VDVKWTEDGEVNSTALLTSTPEGCKQIFTTATAAPDEGADVIHGISS